MEILRLWHRDEVVNLESCNRRVVLVCVKGGYAAGKDDAGWNVYDVGEWATMGCGTEFFFAAAWSAPLASARTVAAFHAR